MEEKTLIFSQETIKERKRILYLTMFMLPFMLVFFSYFFSVVKGDGTLKAKPLIIIMSIIVPIVTLEIVIISKIMFKKISEMKLVVAENMVSRVGGKFEEIIKYGDIVKLTVKRNKKDQIIYLKVKISNETINLSGFENMDNLFMDFRENITGECEIVEIKNRVNWNNPFIAFITMVVSVLVITAMFLIEIKVYEIFYILFPIAFGIVFLMSKPISKNAGTRFRKFEIIISCIILAGGILTFIGKIIK